MTPWWREAVFYQIYVRSFADSNGDGIGDLPGIISRLPYVADLGVDAIWLTPFYPSPMVDGGYDVTDYRDVDPRFGSLADVETLVAEAHRYGLRVLVDLVPNHTSVEHPWFRAALAAPPGSPARARYHFRPADPRNPDRPPNDWPANFGGIAWTRLPDGPDGSPGEWYLHLFAPSQPDLNWEHPEVRAEFEDILRFWLARGVDGFRIDVAHGLVKAPGLPSLGPEALARHRRNPLDPSETIPMWDQPGVHEIYRSWRQLLDSHDGPPMTVGEVWLGNATAIARYVRPDELNQAFNFPWLLTWWDAASVQEAIEVSMGEFGAVGAVPSWVLSNHDVWRPASRYGIGAVGLARARAMAVLMHALPGSSYVYQGEELGLPEVLDLPDESLQDPTWERSGHTVRGRDGCRVPIPWSGATAPYGFGPEGSAPWLPQPDSWAGLSVAAQDGVPGSTLTMFRALLRLRREHLVGAGAVSWFEDSPSQVIGFRRGSVIVVMNFGQAPARLPAWADEREVLVSSDPAYSGGDLPPDTCAWLR